MRNVNICQGQTDHSIKLQTVYVTLLNKQLQRKCFDAISYKLNVPIHGFLKTYKWIIMMPSNFVEIRIKIFEISMKNFTIPISSCSCHR